MRRAAKWLTRLYPRAWRERYGEEFEALLEDSKLRWTDLPNVVWSAFRLHDGHRAMALLVLVGLLAGAVFAWRVPREYAAQGALTLRDSAKQEDVGPFLAEALSRGQLAAVAARVGLYPEERRRQPLEYVITHMREKLHVSSRSVEFEYPDPERARATVQAIVQQLTQVADSPFASGSLTDPGRELGRLGARLSAIAWGLLAGLAGAFCIARPRVAIACVAGALLGLGITCLFPDRYASTAIVRADPVLIDTVLTDRALYSGGELQVSTMGSAKILTYAHADRRRSQETLRDILGKLRTTSWAEQRTITHMRIVDAPTLPQSQMPRHEEWFVFFGALTGLAVMRFVPRSYRIVR